MLAWLATAVGHGDVCSDSTAYDACRAGADIGVGIALVFILLIAALGDVILGVIWMVTRPSTPPQLAPLIA